MSEPKSGWFISEERTDITITNLPFLQNMVFKLLMVNLTYPTLTYPNLTYPNLTYPNLT